MVEGDESHLPRCIASDIGVRFGKGFFILHRLVFLFFLILLILSPSRQADDQDGNEAYEQNSTRDR